MMYIIPDFTICLDKDKKTISEAKLDAEFIRIKKELDEITRDALIKIIDGKIIENKIKFQDCLDENGNFSPAKFDELYDLKK